MRLAGVLACCCLASGLAGAQPASPSAADQELPPPPSLGPIVAPPPPATKTSAPTLSVAKPQAKVIERASGPPRPERSAVAVIRVLDKVTAETLRFAAPVGRKVRYRGLVFEVKACEAWGDGSADPRPSAYLMIYSDLGGGDNQSKQIFKGWMFAQAPSVHAIQHPVYDAWLESCIASAPGI